MRYSPCAVAISSTSFLAIYEREIREFDISLAGPTSSQGWRDHWPKMETSRTNWPGCAKVGNKVIVAGGNHVSTIHQTTEILDLETRRISKAGNLVSARCFFHIITLDNNSDSKRLQWEVVAWATVTWRPSKSGIQRLRLGQRRKINLERRRVSLAWWLLLKAKSALPNNYKLNDLTYFITTLAERIRIFTKIARVTQSKRIIYHEDTIHFLLIEGLHWIKRIVRPTQPTHWPVVGRPKQKLSWDLFTNYIQNGFFNIFTIAVLLSNYKSDFKYFRMNLYLIWSVFYDEWQCVSHLSSLTWVHLEHFVSLPEPHILLALLHPSPYLNIFHFLWKSYGNGGNVSMNIIIS